MNDSIDFGKYVHKFKTTGTINWWKHSIRISFLICLGHFFNNKQKGFHKFIKAREIAGKIAPFLKINGICILWEVEIKLKTENETKYMQNPGQQFRFFFWGLTNKPIFNSLAALKSAGMLLEKRLIQPDNVRKAKNIIDNIEKESFNPMNNKPLRHFWPSWRCQVMLVGGNLFSSSIPAEEH